ncbi:TPA: hypothetical protein SAN82_001854 [Pseudomonas putida]|nr:hypothetical protein [Pseudomonas putida]
MSIRTIINPMPTIPLLGPDNAIDLDRLGSSELETYINYVNIADGDIIIVYWFGCGANGEIVDKFNDEVEVLDELLTPDGMPVMIENNIMQLLNNGSVFYAYRVRKPGQQPGDESLRLFFYVGKRPRTTTALPVLQIKESHDRHLYLEDAPQIITPWMAPYQAMKAGDVVTLHCRRYYPDGSEYLPALKYPREVKEGESGEPLALFLNRSELNRVEDGSIELYCGIQYEGTAQETTFSARQTLTLSAPTSPTLPALTIVDHDGGTLNPALFPKGVLVRIPGYPGMAVGDDLYCHASSDAVGVDPVALHARVDASTQDKGFFELQLSADWVQSSQGGAMNLQYQYAWEGIARSATPYQVNVREPLNLPWVIVQGATPDPDKPVEGEAVLNVLSLVTSGINITITPDANHGEDDKVEMHFEGFGTGGKYIATTPTVAEGRTYNIPSHVIPYNFSRPVRVYYTVLQKGDPAPVPSKVFILWILPIEKTRYLTIQSTQGQQYNGTIYLSRIGANGELFTLPAWPYIRAGQKVHVVMKGKNSSDEPLSIPVIDNYSVTSTDVTARKVEKYFSFANINRFKLGSVSVDVTITYEEGAATQYSPASFVLAS